jgi:hypothetical protein
MSKSKEQYLSNIFFKPPVPLYSIGEKIFYIPFYEEKGTFTICDGTIVRISGRMVGRLSYLVLDDLLGARNCRWIPDYCIFFEDDLDAFLCLDDKRVCIDAGLQK